MLVTFEIILLLYFIIIIAYQQIVKQPFQTTWQSTSDLTKEMIKSSPKTRASPNSKKVNIETFFKFWLRWSGKCKIGIFHIIIKVLSARHERPNISLFGRSTLALFSLMGDNLRIGKYLYKIYTALHMYYIYVWYKSVILYPTVLGEGIY